jgi:hypothetical protein
MQFLVLVPWKPVVLVWALLTAMILVGFTASSLLQGKDPHAPGVAATHSLGAKASGTHSGQQAKHSHKAAQDLSH